MGAALRHVTSYTLGYVNYDDSAIGFFEDRYEHTFGNEFRFLLTPTTTLVANTASTLLITIDANHQDSQSHFLPRRLRSQLQPALQYFVPRRC